MNIDKFKELIEAFQPHRRPLILRLSRRLRDKLNSKTDDLLVTRKSRQKRFRRHSLKNVMSCPKKILGSRFRKR